MMYESDYILERRRKMLGLSEPKEDKKPAKINPVAKKREKLQKEYRKVVKEMLAKDGRCEIHSPVCTGKAEGLHHIVKRSVKNLMKPENLKRSCNACNSFIEANVDWAQEHGFVKSKFKS